MDETRSFISNSEKKDAGRLFVKLLLFIPALLLVLTVNFYIDLKGSYGKSDQYRLAQELAAGRNVAAYPTSDDRLLRKYMIEDTAVAPDIVVLGSSHASWLGDNIFPGKKVANDTVQSAALTDYLGIFEEYAKKGLYPHRVILLLDPQLIGYPIFSEKWLSIKEDTYGMLDRLEIRSEKIKDPVIPQAWFNVFSFSYFQGSVERFWNDLGQHVPFISGYITLRKYLYFKDGRWVIIFPSKGMGRNKNTPPMVLYHWTDTQKLIEMKPDIELEGILERFIRYLSGRHIQVTLCLLPFHPDLYKNSFELQKRHGVFDLAGVERYYRGLAQKLNLEIIGSYDPAACDLDSKDFYDGEHIKNNVLEEMLKQQGSKCSMPGI